MKRRGFSLLEVLFAVALFGAVVTFILSAEAGLVAGDKSAASMTQAIEIGRCRMSEVEEKQLKLGFPEIEEKDSSNICCDDKEVPGYSCEWAVERVIMPDANPASALAGDGGLNSILGGGLGLDAGIASIGNAASSVIASPVGTMLVNPMGSAGLDFDAGITGVTQSLQQSLGGAGAQGLLSMVFAIVYPSLKPLLEAAIRRVTVTIRWKEGSLAREFVLQQYLTNPSRAGLLGDLADAGVFGEGGIPITTGGAGGTGAAGAPGAAGPGALPSPLGAGGARP
jgi:general secretion pathway protein I